MCGICGIITTNASRYREPILKMIESLAHRGPDGNGFETFEEAILGHTRLSIVDVEGGAQPMHNRDHSIAITFNGEIYGYRDIKKTLDYPFQTQCDTELILALYEKHGENLFEHLPGMFSFALWDDRKKLLLCSRDRFGEKPFFYAISEANEFIFGSEIKAILASGLIKPKLSYQAISQYLQRGYTGPRFTIYENIQSLPPAHYLIFRDGKLTMKKYWHFPKINHNITFEQAKEQFHAHLSKAIENQLVADVDVGSFLSGGLDSSTIVTLASKYKPSLNTYSFGFQKEHNELPLAAQVAGINHTHHHEMMEENVDVNSIIFKLPDMYDEPFADSSSIPTYLICKKAREYNKVVLGGEGGDELLGGYTWWFQEMAEMYEMKKARHWKKGKVTALAYAEKIASKLHLFESTHYRGKKFAIRNNRHYPTLLGRFLSTGNVYKKNDYEKLGLPDFINEIPNKITEKDELNSVFHHIIENYMVSDILVKTDMASMANSLELRSPFLDLAFANFCLSLPPKFKVDCKNSKIILREAMKPYLPASILKKKKQGFGAPNNWQTTPSVLALKKEYLDDPTKKIFDFLPFKEVNELMRKTDRFWEFLVLAVWFEQKHMLFA